MCIQLHKENEIDDNLLPIGKENFKARPEDAEVAALPDESRVDDSEARPGTTKRRQYYYKKVCASLAPHNFSVLALCEYYSLIFVVVSDRRPKH